MLINNPETYQTIKEEIDIKDFKNETNIKILEQLYKELEKTNPNINIVLDHIEDEEIQNHLTEIMAEDYGITDNEKAIKEIAQKYRREKLEKRRDELITQEKQEHNLEKKRELQKELNDIILKLVKIK